MPRLMDQDEHWILSTAVKLYDNDNVKTVEQAVSLAVDFLQQARQAMRVRAADLAQPGTEPEPSGPPALAFRLRLNNETDPKDLPNVLRHIAADIHAGKCATGASYPVRADTGEVIGLFSWDYEHRAKE